MSTMGSAFFRAAGHNGLRKFKSPLWKCSFWTQKWCISFVIYSKTIPGTKRKPNAKLKLTAFSKKKGRQTCRNSFSAVSKALMLSNGAFFAEWCTLQRETKRKHGIDEKSTVSANAKNPAPRAVHKQHPNLLPNTLSSKGANQEVLLALHPALRPPRSAPYRGERTSKLGDFIYNLPDESPPKLGRIRVDFEKLWPKRFSRKVHDP